MNPQTSTSNTTSPKAHTLRKINQSIRHHRAADVSPQQNVGELLHPGEIRVICLYPTVAAGKMARQWLENAIRTTAPRSCSSIEYFNYAVLNHEGISWRDVVGRVKPDIILMVGDGSHTLGAGLRHSLRELFAQERAGRKPLVIFRDLEPQPTLNTRILLDYVSVLTRRNQCELNAMNGNGMPISCFRHPRHLLKTRRYQE
jgi:hypothetical protein